MYNIHDVKIKRAPRVVNLANSMRGDKPRLHNIPRYTEGVYSSKGTSNGCHHAALIVGYTPDYYIVSYHLVKLVVFTSSENKLCNLEPSNPHRYGTVWACHTERTGTLKSREDRILAALNSTWRSVIFC